jgi:hypothetical protein
VACAPPHRCWPLRNGQETRSSTRRRYPALVPRLSAGVRTPARHRAVAIRCRGGAPVRDQRRAAGPDTARTRRPQDLGRGDRAGLAGPGPAPRAGLPARGCLAAGSQPRHTGALPALARSRRLPLVILRRQRWAFIRRSRGPLRTGRAWSAGRRARPGWRPARARCADRAYAKRGASADRASPACGPSAAITCSSASWRAISYAWAAG